MFKIEKNIPIQSTRGGKSLPGLMIYPWDQMDIGDSFLVEVLTSDQSTRIIQRRISPQARIAGMRFGRKFITRTQENGVRVWRIA